MRLGAGPLSATLDGLALRWVRWHEQEILRGIAFVVRDGSWGTYAPAVEIVSRETRADAVLLHLQGVIAAPRIVCEMRVSFSPSRIDIKGVARAQETFRSNRTGFVVLHGEAAAGTSVEVEHVDGTHGCGTFPERISPYQPLVGVRAVTHAPLPGLRVRVAMTGETFEMEDHRNWSDCGFKTYCRPLAAPRPFTVAAGTEISQSVRVTLDTGLLGKPVLPRIARGAPSAGVAELPEDAALLLAESRTGHDLDAFARLLARTARPGAILLSASAERPAALDALVALPPLEALLLTDATAAELAHAREKLPGVRIGAGSAAHFAEFNRAPPPPGIDFAFWGISATVHATDDASVIATLCVLAEQARSARALVPGVPLWVGPIGIGPRWIADPREAGALGAAFVAGHLAAWAEAGVETLILPPRLPVPALA